MKKIILRYNLEMFTAVVLVFTIVDAVLFSEISYFRKLVNMFMIMGALHEWEEKRYPGGFFELMIRKFDIKTDKAGLDKACLCVIIYWLVITIIPYIFDGVICLLLISVFLGLFEAFVHTMGIFLHKMKKPYTPGLVSAWIMAAGSIYTIYYVETSGLASAGDYILGAVLMFGGFLLMDLGVLRSVGMGPKDVAAKVKSLRS